MRDRVVEAKHSPISCVRSISTWRPGEIVTVAGTNGAGKSTLIKAVMG
jgi:ABC-type branched-subunit amino acid transport system ATPase component